MSFVYQPVNLSAASVQGVLPVLHGGTGLATLTANNVLLGNGTSAVQFVAPSTNGNVLTSNGTTWVSSTAPAAAPGYTTKTANYSAANGDYISADTSGGSFTVTLPAAPTTGNTISFLDAKGTFQLNPLYINPNGKTIMGDSATSIIGTNGYAFTLVYNGADWRIV